MRALIAVLLVILAGTPAAAGERNFRTPAVLYGGLAVSDLVTTEMFRARGVKEANPLMGSRGSRLAIEATVWAGSTWLDEYASHRVSKRTLWIGRGVVILGTGYIVSRNLRAWSAAKRPDARPR
jgi:hypothetical protein